MNDYEVSLELTKLIFKDAVLEDKVLTVEEKTDKLNSIYSSIYNNVIDTRLNHAKSR